MAYHLLRKAIKLSGWGVLTEKHNWNKILTGFVYLYTSKNSKISNVLKFREYIPILCEVLEGNSNATEKIKIDFGFIVKSITFRVHDFCFKHY